MRKGKLGMTLGAALVLNLLIAGPASQAYAGVPGKASEWNQLGHDASHTGASDAAGPVRPEVVPGWPLRCPVFSCRAMGATAFLDDAPTPGERHPAAFFTSENSDYEGSLLFGYGPDGQRLPGSWPADLGQPDTIGGHAWYPPLVSTRRSDRIYALNNVSHSEPGGDVAVWALGADGRALPGWPVTIRDRYNSGPATLTDGSVISHIPEETLYFATHAYNDAEDGGTLLHALRRDGSDKPGWPVALDEDLRVFDGPAVGPDGTVYAGAISYVAVWPDETRAWLLAFKPDGTAKRGWPFSFPPRYTSGGGFSPAVGHDGAIRISASDISSTNCSISLLYTFAPNGQVKEGWPAQVQGDLGGTSVARDGTAYASAYDCGVDPGEGLVHAFDTAGNEKPGWPKVYSGTNLLSSIALGDADADPATTGDEQVYFGVRGTLYGYDPAGRPLPGFPMTIPGAGIVVSPMVASDGRLYFTDDRDWLGKPDRFFAVRSSARGELGPLHTGATGGGHR